MAERFTSLTNWLWPQAYPGYATEGQAYFSGPDPRQWIGDLIGGNSPNPNYGKTGDQIISEFVQKQGYSDPLSYAKATFAKADATPGYWDANERATLKQDASGNWGVGTADYEDSGISMLGLLGTFAGAAGLGGLMGGAFSGAGAAGAGSAMDMGIGGVGEAMGLGAGYTSPLAGVADTAWGVNQGANSVDMTGFLNSSNPFSYTPEFSYLGDSTLGSMIPDTIGAQLPGGAWSNVIAPGAGGVAGNPFGLLDLGGNAGAIPGANLGGNAGWLETVKNLFNSGKGITPGSGGVSSAGSILGNGSAGSGGGLGGLENLLSSQGLGAVLGGLAGLYGGSDKPAGTTTTVEDLPEWTKPFALTGLNDMSAAFGTAPSQSPVTLAGEGYYGDVLAGDYLNNNPYLDAMYDKAAGKVSAGVNAMFSKANRYGSGAHQGVLGETLGNLATDIYGQNYAKERGYQNQLAMDSDDFGTASILQPFRRGQALLGGATSVRGGSSTAPYFRNKAGEVLAGALGGSRLFS